MSKRFEPVSQLDIAKALGISQSTVSLALRGNDEVSEKTRRQVALKAKELGYVHNPKMGALTSYRQTSSIKRVVPRLAWVTNFPTEKGWRKSHNLKYYNGARRRAAELGFELVEYWLSDVRVSKEKLQKELTNLEISGLLFAPQATLEAKIDLDLTAFSSVSIGGSLKSPILHSVDSHAVGNVQQAVLNLRLRGYKRVGLAACDSIDTRVDGAYSGGFLSVDDGGAIPPFMIEPFDHNSFGHWFRRWQPDAIVAWGDYLTRIESWLVGHGIEVGREIALAGLDLEDEKGKYAGIYQQSELIGEVAVETLVTYFNQFAYGVPEYAYQTLIDGRWVDGRSAPGK
ncbi:LacI family DNA-binding transcriptional regulator [Pelagicoccus sp. SDUM812005]|uniref:LacI family DNA-binding transcriptional regulator n=1 Tax=Pelagicoccus sp. SDUM812005 TaxID=3041257 RepID=UPI00280D8045|nr:LacI family DNA-binding transcriptional regulator [Pelagicoccus sp. SDUM812005]MDQ8183147.1 LacI family DNA-binding transcriptional regulator [Pelagicoccus sp. SDUM812005]